MIPRLDSGSTSLLQIQPFAWPRPDRRLRRHGLFPVIKDFNIIAFLNTFFRSIFRVEPDTGTAVLEFIHPDIVGNEWNARGKSHCGSEKRTCTFLWFPDLKHIHFLQTAVYERVRLLRIGA